DFTRIQLAGTLLANGTALEPVVITGLKDDSFAGDTNGDGTASLPLPGNWYGILVDASGAATVLDHAEIRYAGSFGTGGIHVNQPGADVTLTNCVIRNCERNAIRMNHLAAFPTVTGCRFE